MLEIGNGVHPLQWFSNLFMHGGIMHLLGNMVFLWVFGIIVEGKLGWWAFAWCTWALACGECSDSDPAPSQAPGVHAGGLGCHRRPVGHVPDLAARKRDSLPRVLADRSDRHRPVDPLVRRILHLHGHDRVRSARVHDLGTMAHLGGTALGFVVAIVLLKLKLVDCENWDIFAVMQGRQGESKKAARKRRSMMVRPSRDLTRLPGDEPKKTKKKGTGMAGGPRGVTSIEDSSRRGGSNSAAAH